MLNLNKFYRSTYFGENIIAERKLENGIWHMTTELVPNNVNNNQISNRAVVFGNGIQRKSFDVAHLLTKKSGLLGADTLQVYACNAFHRDYTPDFLVVTDRRIADQVVRSGYTHDNIVYARVDLTLEFPKRFYLIPHDTYSDAGTTAIYLAAFDGHKRVYMVGFDNQDTPGYNNNIYAGTLGYDSLRTTISDTKWINDKATVFRVYDDVDFVLVSETGRQTIPEEWKYFSNLRQLSFRDMVLEADL